MWRYGNAVAIDGGEIVLSVNIDGGEITLVNQMDGDMGTFMPILPDQYTGDLTVTPKAWQEQVLETAFKTMPGNVVVLEVPYYENPNTDGTTVYIANEV